MLEIYNGREKFYQWDVNQKLIVDDDIIAVQYDNGTGDALVCGVYEYNGVKVADVPNIMLQTYWAIHAYAYCGECVRGDKVIEVEKRSRPDDYVYTETETLRYSTLYERVKTLEEQHIEEVESVAAQLEEANSRIDELEQRPTGGGVKDWNENNPDSPAYIANRTHYDEWGEMEFMPETVADAIVPEEAIGVFINPVEGIEIGNEYTVYYNGTPYQCVAVNAAEVDLPGIALGNVGMMTGGTDTGEPFIAAFLTKEMAAEMGMGVFVLMMDGAESLTLRVVGEGLQIHKIDDKYINVRQPDWDAEPGEMGYIANRTHYKDAGFKYEFDYNFPLIKEYIELENGVKAYKVANKPVNDNVWNDTTLTYYDENGMSYVVGGYSTNYGNGYKRKYRGEYPNGTGIMSIDDKEMAQMMLGLAIPSNGTYIYSNEYTTLLVDVPDAITTIPEEYLDLSKYKKEPQYNIVKTISMKGKTDTEDIDVSGYNRVIIQLYGVVPQTTDTMKMKVYDVDNKYIVELPMDDIITQTKSINQYITMYYDGEHIIFEKDDMAAVKFNAAQRYRNNISASSKKQFGKIRLYTTNYAFKSDSDFIRVWGAKV